MTKSPNDEYHQKFEEELRSYKDNINVHELPSIFHYWSNKYLLNIFRDVGIESIEQFFFSNLLNSAYRSQIKSPSFISIGSGNCDLEIDIAKNLIKAGLDNFTLECLDINPAMLDRGKRLAKDNGVFEKLLFVEGDFNEWVPDKKYQGVIANQSLHHVVQLEHLFDQIKNCLDNNGNFIISDMIGRNGHQRWPEALKIVNKFWKELPNSKKYNVLLNRLEEEYDNFDCSKEGFEGIRAQDVLPLLNKRFECEKFVGFGNVIDIFVDRCFGHNFNPDLQEDRDFIDRVHLEDEHGFADGSLKPTHMVAVFVKNLKCEPIFSRNISPTKAVRNP